MKHQTLTLSDCEPSQDFGNLAELDHEAFRRLTEDGPVMRPGSIMLTEEAFVNVIPEYVWTALALHECANWGACGKDQASANDQALTLCGSVLSRWLPEDTFEFTIETTLEPGQEQTTVSVSSESAPMCEAPSSTVQLGDVLLDDSVYPVAFKHIWSALRQHGMGSPGDSNLFPRRSSFRLGDTAVSWWAHPDNPELLFPPFWVLTHLSEPRLTYVFTGLAGIAL